MKLLITGASGLYGSSLAEIALKEQHQTYAIYNQHTTAHGIPIQIDISDKDKVEAEFKKVQPEIVVHAASLTDVDKCELNRELAWKINVEGTRNIAQAAKNIGAFLLYISTDYVFDGEKGNYKETDLLSPINYYGYTKMKAEEQIKEATDKFCIARASVIYGAAPAAGKTNFALWLLNKLKNNEQTKVFTDQWNTPTLNTNLAEMTLEIAERKLYGVYHLSGATRMSRYEFATAFAKTFNLNTNLLVPTTSSQLSFPAKRPKDSSLNTQKAQRSLKHKPLQIDKAIEKLKEELTKIAAYP